MRILIVVPSLKSGGLERVATIIANDLSIQEKTKITIVSLNSSYSFYYINDSVQVLGFDYSFKNKLFKLIPLFIWFIFKINQQKPDKILSFGEGHNSFVILACRFLGYNNISVFNRASPISSLDGIRGFLNPFFYKFAKNVIVQTKSAKNIISKKYYKSNIKVIPNPITSIHKVIPMSQKELKIINVGYLGGKKNQNLLIDFFSIIDPVVTKDWTLHFVGDGPYREALESKVEKLKLSNQIFFNGKIKNISKYYNSSSIFAFCSHSEGFPNALAEAMSYGCACISFDCIAGPSELIDDGKSGFLIDIKNNKSYVDKLHNLMTDCNLRKKFSENSLKKVKLFNRNRIIKDIYNII
ncbi:MAG: hypothetical protein CMC04_03985 [Flavobacteriaceae bacterium]|nr:hypothetical protein [Flavobacteriaceae bacterium]|tara:strand:- start:1134 stop:2195 length:1062 start_codon:yes stop_codon:yes gene_type:complete